MAHQPREFAGDYALADSVLVLDNSRPQQRSAGAFDTVAYMQNKQFHIESHVPDWAIPTMQLLSARSKM
jgi:hypothetical protein